MCLLMSYRPRRSVCGVTIARLTSFGAAGVGVVLRALWEELLFLGLLGGVFMRRLGFF